MLVFCAVMSRADIRTVRSDLCFLLHFSFLYYIGDRYKYKWGHQFPVNIHKQYVCLEEGQRLQGSTEKRRRQVVWRGLLEELRFYFSSEEELRVWRKQSLQEGVKPWQIIQLEGSAEPDHNQQHTAELAAYFCTHHPVDGWKNAQLCFLVCSSAAPPNLCLSHSFSIYSWGFIQAICSGGGKFSLTHTHL